MPGYHTNAVPTFDIPRNMFCGDPGGRAERESPSLRAPFQVLVRLQYLRALVGSWRLYDPQGVAAEPLENVIWGLRGLAGAALEFGSVAYATMCLECAKRVESVCHARTPHREVYDLLGAWLASSDHYLRNPARAAATVGLVARFAVLCGDEEMLNTTAQSALFSALLFPA